MTDIATDDRIALIYLGCTPDDTEQRNRGAKILGKLRTSRLVVDRMRKKGMEVDEITAPEKLPADSPNPGGVYLLHDALRKLNYFDRLGENLFDDDDPIIGLANPTKHYVKGRELLYVGKLTEAKEKKKVIALIKRKMPGRISPKFDGSMMYVLLAAGGIAKLKKRGYAIESTKWVRRLATGKGVPVTFHNLLSLVPVRHMH